MASLQRMQKVLIIYSLLPLETLCSISYGFHTLSLPHNMLCPTGVLKANSKIECASRCLLRNNYDNYTAFTFDILLLEQTPCACQRAKCVPDPPDTSIDTSTNVLVNMKCDTSNVGMVNVKAYIYISCLFCTCVALLVTLAKKSLMRLRENLNLHF